ncbi:phosphatidylinositol N-acetylglucosaminyltransferase subunit P [Aethina tumida]|uniref:phosphatidylinositol N-acetylglucosaminyltransferase subunit P n=1 Tax=Aethina tumida TaxID=116153 RepID=UPI00096ADCC7|nr:phosphatidylinositol N-acetylglucosaminyltransferase subunit P [Aethina tumida]
MPEHTPAPTPSRAVYGFVLYLSFKLFFILYVIWAVVPEKYFPAFGIDFLPKRHWAITVPIFLLTVLTIFAFFIYPSIGLIMTPHIDDMRTITDEVGSLRKANGKHLARNVSNTNGECSCKIISRCYKEQYIKNEAVTVDKSIPVLKDLNIWDVSKHLYLK